MDRTQKQELVTSLRDLFDNASGVVITHYSGLTVAEITKLREDMREAGAGFKVTKNRITRLALEGTKFEDLADSFTGPTAIAYSEDPIAPAKVAVNFAKTNDKLKVVAGSIGAGAIDAAGVAQLATLPSLDEIRATIIGLLNAPATKIAGVTQAPAGQLARVFSAYAEQG